MRYVREADVTANTKIAYWGQTRPVLGFVSPNNGPHQYIFDRIWQKYSYFFSFLDAISNVQILRKKNSRD